MPTAEAALLDADEAGQVCLDNQTRFSPDDSITGPVRVVERTVLPKWLVVIPAENVHGPYTAFCFVHEEASAAENSALAQTTNDSMTEERIEFLTHNNEYM